MESQAWPGDPDDKAVATEAKAIFIVSNLLCCVENPQKPAGAKEKPQARRPLNRTVTKPLIAVNHERGDDAKPNLQNPRHGLLSLQREGGRKRPARNHAAYIAREGSYAERDGYEDLEATGHGNLPSWPKANHPGSGAPPTATNGPTARPIGKSKSPLPRELNPDQRQALVLDFIRQEVGAHAHQWAIHNPGAALAGANNRTPISCVPERTMDGIERGPSSISNGTTGTSRTGRLPERQRRTEERLLETRQRWAEVQNAHLQQHVHAARVDHRSLAAQGIDRAPEQHLGGRRVRQLAPDQREALLERRAAEDELQHSQRALAPFDLAQHLHALTAAAQQREQAEQAARMAEARAYCQQTLNAFRAELAQKAEQERAEEAAPTAARGGAGALATARTRTGTAFEPFPTIGIGSPAFVERLQAARPDDGAAPSATRAVLRPRNRHRHGHKGSIWNLSGGEPIARWCPFDGSPLRQ